MTNKVGTGGYTLGLPILRNITADTSRLSCKEKEIMKQIQEKVNDLGVPVKINMGQKTESGLTISLIGFAGASADGTRSPFLITKDILEEMATDESKYNKWMAWVQEQKQELVSLENSLKENKRMAEQMDADRRSEQVRTNMMSVLDFWKENNGKSWSLLSHQYRLANLGGL